MLNGSGFTRNHISYIANNTQLEICYTLAQWCTLLPISIKIVFFLQNIYLYSVSHFQSSCVFVFFCQYDSPKFKVEHVRNVLCVNILQTGKNVEQEKWQMVGAYYQGKENIQLYGQTPCASRHVEAARQDRD